MATQKTTNLDRVHTSDNALQVTMERLYGNLIHESREVNQLYPIFFSIYNGGNCEPAPHQIMPPRVPDNEQRRSARHASTSANWDLPEESMQVTSMLSEEIEQARSRSLEDMTARSEEIESIYNAILDRHDEATKGLGRRDEYLENIRDDIEEQKVRFKVTSESLLKAVSTASIKDVEQSIVLYTQVLEKLGTICLVLKDAPGHFRKIFCNIEVTTSIEVFATFSFTNTEPRVRREILGAPKSKHVPTTTQRMCWEILRGISMNSTSWLNH